MDAKFKLMLNVYCLLILIILSTVFFLKQRLHKTEDNLYGEILLSCIFTIVVGLILGIITDNYQIANREIIISILNRGYLFGIFFVISLFGYYTYYISKKKKENNEKRSFTFFTILNLINLIIIYILPMNVVETNGVTTTSGDVFGYSFIMFIVIYIIMIIMIIRDIKNIKNKKYIPILSLILTSLTVDFLMATNPELNYLLNPITVMNIMIMYFTIENPDLKIIAELHNAKDISDNANEEKAMFLYNMTNEIRNITKDIDISADQILSEVDNKKVDIENISNTARDIKVSTAKFTTMTNEILDISQVDSANIKIYNDKYNIKLIIKELVQLYKGKCEKKGLEFRTTIASDLPEYLYGDSVGVKKSLSVILDNSINYTDNGYVEFTIDTITKGDVARLIITVEDSGIGMSAEELSKIFNTRKEHDDNTNLNKNLYNARKLITLMGGTIIPSSVYGKGTTMKVVLDQKIAKMEGKLTKYEEVLDKQKILLVDDNEASIKLITKMITDTNIILEVVKSGKDCLDKIRDKEKYDLILLSEKMEPLDGITVMKKLKEIRNFNTKVILLTRDNDYEYNEEYLKYGFVDHILKPITKDNLLEKINKYLS